ncbi:putative immunoglobulin like protein [Trypoxylus dichotomus]
MQDIGYRKIKVAKYKGIDAGDGTGTGIAKLQISVSRGDLQKDFKCVVESEALEEPIVTMFTADVNVKPTGIKLSGVNGHVVQGSFVKLVCEVTGAKPAAEVKWFNRSAPVGESLISTALKAMPDGTYLTKSSLEFIASSWENGNAFHCEADNTVTRDLQDLSLRAMHLLEVYYAPVVTVEAPISTVNETDKYVLLNCAYHSNPMKLDDALWSKDGKNLTLTTDKYEGGDVENLPLVIKDITREDQGNYTCTCRNSVGSQESENYIFLNVQFPPTVELAILSEMPIKAVEEKDVTLVCTPVHGNPVTLSKVRWFLADELLKELPECNYTSYDDEGRGQGYGGPLCSVDSHILSLVNVSEGFAGNYTCQGQNIAGWGPKSEPQELIVYYPPGPASLKASSTKVIKKSSVTLTCSVKNPGKPEAITYVWYRGNHLISDITSFNWTINPVTYETKSNYTCYAHNDGGDSTPASIFVNVSAPPAFIQNLQPYQGILYTTSNISLTCRVECSPECSIVWLRNSQIIPKSDVLYSFKETKHPADLNKNDFESVESTLLFNMYRWPDKQLNKSAPNSFYACQSSSNGIGPGVTSIMEIAVDYPPEDVKASKAIIDVQENNKPETINCTGKGHPTLTYVWKNAQGVNVSTNHVLSLKTVTRGDAGKYYCEASNKHGKLTTNADLNVQYVPSCTLSLEKHKGSASLKCESEANPLEVTFRFQIKGENETIDPNLITQDGNKGYLELDDSIETFRTYQCFVNNSVGIGVPCERDVLGIAPWWKQLFGDNLIIVIAALAAIIIIIIICIIIILICRRKRSNNKYNNPVEMEEREKSVIWYIDFLFDSSG